MTHQPSSQISNARSPQTLLRNNRRNKQTAGQARECDGSAGTTGMKLIPFYLWSGSPSARPPPTSPWAGLPRPRNIPSHEPQMDATDIHPPTSPPHSSSNAHIYYITRTTTARARLPFAQRRNIWTSAHNFWGLATLARRLVLLAFSGHLSKVESKSVRLEEVKTHGDPLIKTAN